MGEKWRFCFNGEILSQFVGSVKENFVFWLNSLYPPLLLSRKNEFSFKKPFSRSVQIFFSLRSSRKKAVNFGIANVTVQRGFGERKEMTEHQVKILCVF